MAGYSGTPLTKKLGVKPGHRIALVDAPKDSAKLAADFPAGTSANGKGPLDFTIIFSKSAASLTKQLAAGQAKMAIDGMIWIAWPKKASGVATDLTEDVVRKLGIAQGLVDIKVCAIDETWSGLKFVIPLKARAKGH